VVLSGFRQKTHKESALPTNPTTRMMGALIIHNLRAVSRRNAASDSSAPVLMRPSTLLLVACSYVRRIHGTTAGANGCSLLFSTGSQISIAPYMHLPCSQSMYGSSRLNKRGPAQRT
jgi:hypothetical protein